MNTQSGGWIIAAAAAAAAAGIFGIDLLLPLGYAVPMLYVLPILLTGLLPGRHSTILIVGSALLLTWIGAGFSPGEVTVEAVTNRAMASALLFTIGWLLLLQKESARKITEAQQARNESEERLRLAQSAEGFGTFDWDISRYTVSWSPETERMWGLPVGGFEGTYEHWRRLVHPDDVEKAEHMVRLALDNPDIFYAYDHRIVHPDGTVRWIHAKATTVRDAAGRPIRMVGVNSDITRRKQAEESLRKAQNLLQDTEKIGHVGGWEFNIDTRKQTWTDEVYHIHEVSRDFEPTVDNGISFYAPESRSTIEYVVQRAIEAGEPFDVELEFITAKGNRRWVHAIGRRDWEGRRVHGFFQDITDRKQAQEALQQLTESLEQQVTDRTLALRESEGQVRADLVGMTMLHQLGMLSMQEKSLKSMLKEILDAGIAILGSDFGNIQLLDQKTGHLKLLVQRGFPDWWVEYWNEVPKEKGACGTALDCGQRVIIEDVMHSPIFADDVARNSLLQVGVRSITSTPLVSRSGKLVGMFSTHCKAPCQIDNRALRLLDLLARQAADTIEHVQITMALMEAEERFRGIFEHAAEGIAITDWEGCFVQCNAAYADIVGYTEHELMGLRFESLVHPDDRLHTLELVRQLVSGAIPSFEVENRYLMKSGRTTWVHKHASILRNDQGVPTYLMVLITDISIRKQAELLLQEKEAFVGDVLDSLSAHVCVLDRDGVILKTNEPWRQFARANSDTTNTIGAVGENYLEVCRRAMTNGDTTVGPILAGIESVLRRRERVFSAEYPCDAPDDKRWFLLRVSPMVDSHGVVLSHLDITDRKCVEELLLLKQQELERSQSQLEDLTAKLLMAQETERRRLARELHDDITQRIAAVAVDLQSLQSVQPGAEAAWITRVHQSAKMAEQIATDLQHLAHQLHPSLLEHVGLQAAVEEHAEEFEMRTGLKTNVVVRHVPATLSIDHATCLYRVLQESLQNVRKHADATSVLVRLFGTKQGIGLCVHDDGHGFDHRSTCAGNIKGLGLISMQERVEALHGAFRIKTKPGDGTEIHAWVPLEDVMCES